MKIVEAAILRAPLASATVWSVPVSEPKPISLSDDQLTSLINAAAPLPSPYDRSAFLAAVAAYFAGRESVGDGELHRCIAELQIIYFKAPTMAEVTRKGPRQMEKVRRAAAAD